MESALVAGSRVRADGFVLHSTLHPDPEVLCLCCGAPAYFGGKPGSSRGVYYSHAPARAGQPDPSFHCPLHSKNDRRFAWQKSVERDPGAGEGFRRRFLEDAQLKPAFAFCLRTASSTPPMSAESFARLLRVADGLDLWSLKGLTPWTLSMLLLTLEDLPSKSRDLRPIWYRFELSKPRGLKEVSVSAGQLAISKHFVNRDGSTGALLSKGRNHHVEVTQEEFARIAGSSDWVSTGTLIAIRRRADHLVPASQAAPAGRPAPVRHELL
jgi:hypothetical protein